MAGMKFVFGLLTFVTVGMIVGALFQLAFIRRLEESSGIPHWVDDKEAVVLHLGIVKPEVLSWSPRIILFRNFLSMEECDYLRAIARPRLKISNVVDRKTGKGVKSGVRTSSGMFLSPEERKYPIIQAIERRISIYSQIPEENGEHIQVLRYEKNQFYQPHYDFFSDPFNVQRGGQRIATMLMYLTDDVEGGETYFPLGLDGEGDLYSQHGGCEVVGGEKWSATVWMRQGSVTF
ncbi:prolyl 4-hydroxylase 1-like isoform X2 [Macadamia integrifolia]|uniref:prolyl 4-hydroxylase 1-like isoform X2 n=1 Tax=Macadamia integrifolia TaxID=60698 RepID=UPI001C4EB148|nr:prolyl 4-hydroxylase 1-like isoform X2 [Macadamia integrifolia]